MAKISVRAGEAPEIEAFLAERIYEYNAAATGYQDGEHFAAIHRDQSQAIVAGISGYTWGHCCFVSYLWVAESSRRKGLGSELLAAVERHATSRRCHHVLLSSHSFQAPDFYVRHGYSQVARVDDHPVGYANIFYIKRLDTP